MKILISIFLLLNTLFSSAQCLKADIIMVVDWSGSEGTNKDYLTDAVHDYIGSLSLGPSAIKIGIIPFSDRPYMEFAAPLTSDLGSLFFVLNKLRDSYPSGGTQFLSSFYLAREFFLKSETERGEQVLRIIIFISDGEENAYIDRTYTQGLASELKASGIFIWSIITSTESSNDVEHMQKISSGPGYFLERDYQQLKEELLRLNLCP